LQRQYAIGNFFPKITIGCQRKGRRVPRDGDVAAPGCHCCDVSSGQLGRWMLEDDNRWIERERPAEADTKSPAGIQLADGPIMSGAR
jgi:hypothetical protein